MSTADQALELLREIVDNRPMPYDEIESSIAKIEGWIDRAEIITYGSAERARAARETQGVPEA